MRSPTLKDDIKAHPFSAPPPPSTTHSTSISCTSLGNYKLLRACTLVSALLWGEPDQGSSTQHPPQIWLRIFWPTPTSAAVTTSPLYWARKVLCAMTTRTVSLLCPRPLSLERTRDGWGLFWHLQPGASWRHLHLPPGHHQAVTPSLSACHAQASRVHQGHMPWWLQA